MTRGTGWERRLSSIVGAWAHLPHRTGGVHGEGRLFATGGMRDANKARCPARDLSCYFEPVSGCAARGGGVAGTCRCMSTAFGV